MTDRSIDAANQGGNTAPFLLAADKEALPSVSHKAAPKKRLEAASTDKLKKALNTIMTRTRELDADGAMVIKDGDALPEMNFDIGLALGAELTRRKVPPIFRLTHYYCSSDSTPPRWHDGDSDLLALMLDLQWLVHWHRPNKGAWESAAKVYDPAQFRSTCRWLHWNGRRSGGQTAKALALTEAQQFELVHVHALYVARRKGWAWALLPVARDKIKAETEQRPHDRRDATSRNETAERRGDLWLCGSLSDRKPQRTAKMYELLTGETLARSIVARHLEKMPDVRQSRIENPS